MLLSTITDLFDSLNEDDQLLLIDALAERTRFHDELGIGLDIAAERGGYPELFPPNTGNHRVWKQHAEQRNARLERAILRRETGLYHPARYEMTEVLRPAFARLTHEQARAMKDEAQRQYEACPHASPLVGRERYRAAIEAIDMLTDRENSIA